jgi:hypothetical protein
VGGEPSVPVRIQLLPALLRTVTMRIKFVTMIALLLAGGMLSGCIIEPGGYHHYYHDRY